MNVMDESIDVYDLGDKCIVLWKDGNYYAGRVQKVLEPSQDVLRVAIARKGNKTEESMPLRKLRKDKANFVPQNVLGESRKNNEKWYYVHYYGWKQNYDEWLPIERMLPHTTHNIEIMQSVKAEIKEREQKAKEELAKDSKKTKRKRASSTEAGEGERAKGDGDASSDSKPKKRKQKSPDDDSKIKSDEPTSAGSGSEKKSSEKKAKKADPSNGRHDRPSSSHRKRKVTLDDGRGYEIKLSVPLELKRLLVKDWELVTRDREILQLPRPVCVREILRDFVDSHKPAASSGTLENLEQYYESMVTYFDYTFGMMLLYRFERNQYYSYFHKDPHFKASLIYGAEHLARLIVIMPAHLSQMQTMDDVTMRYIVETSNKLAEYMIKNKSRYFAGSLGYDAATRLYQLKSIPNSEANTNGGTKPEVNADAEALLE